MFLVENQSFQVLIIGKFEKQMFQVEIFIFIA
jgi:hypothetical protein